MLKITENKLNKIIHDILKVVACLKETQRECLTKEMNEKLEKYENELLRIRSELLESVKDSKEKEK